MREKNPYIHSLINTRYSMHGLIDNKSAEVSVHLFYILIHRIRDFLFLKCFFFHYFGFLKYILQRYLRIAPIASGVRLRRKQLKFSVLYDEQKNSISLKWAFLAPLSVQFFEVITGAMRKKWKSNKRLTTTPEGDKNTNIGRNIYLYRQQFQSNY